jgi:hypothetical protein
MADAFEKLREAKMRARSWLMLSAITLGIAAPTAAGKDAPILSQWTDTAPRIDGAADDWAGLELAPQSLGVKVGFKNDDQYLYVQFLFTDPKALTSVEATGMTIYFDVQGKKSKDRGINFRRLQMTPDEFIAFLEQKQGPLSEDQKKQYRANPRYSVFYYGMISKGVKHVQQAEEREGILPAVFRYAPQPNRAVLFEFAVPLARATDLAPGIGTQAGQTVKVGFEWGGWSRSLQQFSAAQFNQMATMARADRPSDDPTSEGGDPRAVSGMRMGDSPDIAAMRKMQPKKYDIWVDVALAAK